MWHIRKAAYDPQFVQFVADNFACEAEPDMSVWPYSVEDFRYIKATMTSALAPHVFNGQPKTAHTNLPSAAR